VPLGLKRYQRTERPHFLTWSCYRRRQYFGSVAMKDVFVQCLEHIRRRYGFRVYGYVVMPEHVHLLVSEPDIELLSKAIQALKLSVYQRAAASG
jgi:putative transposase